MDNNINIQGGDVNAVDHEDLNGTPSAKVWVPSLVPVFFGLPCLSLGLVSFPRSLLRARATLTLGYLENKMFQGEV